MSSPKALTDLLLSMFSADELRRFVRWGPDGDELERELPGPTASPAALADEVVRAYEARRLVDAGFFARLAEARPRRQAEIAAVQAGWSAQASVRRTSSGVFAAPAQQAIDYAVAVAIGAELSAVLKLLRDTKERSLTDGTIVVAGSLDGPSGPRLVGVYQSGMNNEAAALAAASVFRELRPRAALLVGVAGGLHAEVSLGDVVFATKVYGYESGKEVAGGFRTRPEVGNPGYRLLQRASFEAQQPGWRRRAPDAGEARVHIKPIAAGSRVVGTPDGPTAALLRRHYSDAYAVEMEGFGFLAAARQGGVEAGVVRGISDLLLKGENQDAEWQPKAAKNAAAFALEVLANLETTTAPVDRLSSAY